MTRRRTPRKRAGDDDEVSQVAGGAGGARATDVGTTAGDAAFGGGVRTAAAPTSAARPDAVAIRSAIERVLGEVEFEPPVSVAYTAAVRDALKLLLPAGTSADVYYTTSPRDPVLVVEVRTVPLTDFSVRRDVSLA